MRNMRIEPSAAILIPPKIGYPKMSIQAEAKIDDVSNPQRGRKWCKMYPKMLLVLIDW